VLLVQVYTDVAAAQPGSERMVEGYSASTWIYSPAFFEANADDYEQIQTAALAGSTGMQSTPIVPTAGARTTRVDADYTSLVPDALTLAQSA
jgi:hypothetical protein